MRRTGLYRIWARGIRSWRNKTRCWSKRTRYWGSRYRNSRNKSTKEKLPLKCSKKSKNSFCSKSNKRTNLKNASSSTKSPKWAATQIQNYLAMTTMSSIQSGQARLTPSRGLMSFRRNWDSLLRLLSTSRWTIWTARWAVWRGRAKRSRCIMSDLRLARLEGSR